MGAINSVWGGIKNAWNGIKQSNQAYGSMSNAAYIVEKASAGNSWFGGVEAMVDAFGHDTKALNAKTFVGSLTAKGANQETQAKILSRLGVKDAFETIDGKEVLKSDLSNVKMNYGFFDHVKLAHMDMKTGGYSAKKIAGTAVGTYMTGAAGYRVLSGGGLYKDADGNTNIIGIPGI